MHDDRIKGFRENSLHDNFRKSTEAIADERSWEWLKKGYMKKGTETIITAAQEQALQANWVKHAIDKQCIAPNAGHARQKKNQWCIQPALVKV